MREGLTSRISLRSGGAQEQEQLRKRNKEEEKGVRLGENEERRVERETRDVLGLGKTSGTFPWENPTYT